MPKLEAIPRILQQPSRLRAGPGRVELVKARVHGIPGQGCFRSHCVCPSYLAASPSNLADSETPSSSPAVS